MAGEIRRIWNYIGTHIFRGPVVAGASSAVASADLTIGANGIKFAADGAADIGSSGSNRPRYIFVSGAVFGGGVYAGSAYQFGWDAKTIMWSTADGYMTISNSTGTGLTELNIGPATGNTSTMGSRLVHVSATVDMATATGTGTGTVTVANFFPANAILLAMTGRVTTVLGGAALGTWSIGHTGDTDAYGTGLAKDAATLVQPSTYTVTSMGQVFGTATNLVITASAGVFSTGVLKVSEAVLIPVPIAAS